MEKRIVYIKIPILLKCNNVNAKNKVIDKFGENIFEGLDYRDDLSVDEVMEIITKQGNIINKINSDYGKS